MRAYGDAITAKNVLDAAKAGDALALEVMDTVCYYLGWALASHFDDRGSGDFRHRRRRIQGGDFFNRLD